MVNPLKIISSSSDAGEWGEDGGRMGRGWGMASHETPWGPDNGLSSQVLVLGDAEVKQEAEKLEKLVWRIGVK